MNEPIYHFQRTGSSQFYTFFSIGIRGEITKMVRISELPANDPGIVENPLFNVAFGDLKESEGKFLLDDTSQSNNGDIRKVMATVVHILEKYMSKHKNAVLSFSGYPDAETADSNANRRMRLYQKIIDSNWNVLSVNYYFWGVLDSHKEKYIVAKPYRRVLVQKKA